MKARELRGLHVASAAHAACARLASREFRDSLICFALALLSFATCVWRWSLVDANLFTSGSALNPAYFTFKLTGYAVRLLGDDPRAGINPDAKLFLFYVYAFYWYTILGGAALLKKALLDTMTATWRSVKSAVAEAERPACAPAA